MWIWVTLDEGQWKTLTSDIHIGSCTDLVNCIYQLWHHRLQWFTFFPYKSIRNQIWPCHKIGQGQLRVIIWANLVILEHPMLHTKFQGHWPFGSREEDFLRFYHIWEWRPSWSCDQEHLSKLSFPHPMWKLHMKFNFDWPCGFWDDV